MEFAFGPADGSGLCLGLRRRGGLRVLPVPGCALPPGEGLELVRACADLAARSGLPMSEVPSEPMKLAMTVVATGPIILLYPFLQKYFVKGVTIGSVKG